MQQKGLIFVFILLTWLVQSASHAANTREYTVILVGNEAGSMQITDAPDNEVHIRYSFNDRGRGPDIDGRYRLDAAGRPEAVTIRGVDYMKAGVEETFGLRGGQAHWQSAADEGSASAGGFYVSLDGPPGEVALLARALLASEDRSVDLLPSGRATIRSVGEVTVGAGRTVRHYEIEGLGFEPNPVWLTQDGQLFAIVSGWFSVLEAGAEELLDTLRDRQNARREARFAAQAEAARTRFSAPVLIDNARIVDVDAGRILEENAVVVEGDTIRALLAPGEQRPPGAILVDAGGQTLLPGLWDMHAHLDLIDGPLNLAAGITTVRDLANDHDGLLRIVKAFDGGAVAGPHVFRAGFIDGTGPFAGPTKARIKNADDGRKWIDFYAEQGYQQIKIYSSIPTELVEGMAERAHEHGMRFSGHVPAGMWAEDAVRAGFDEIQHINMIFLNFYKDIVETRNPDRFIKVAERGADLDPESEPFQRFVRLLREHGTVVDPTVAIFLDLFRHQSGQLAPSLATAEDRLPPSVHRSNLKGGLPVPEGWAARYNASADQLLTIVGALHEAGVPLVAGTDGLAGITLQGEFLAYQEAGIAALDILQLATVGSARVMGVASTVGTIAPGMRADLILVDGQPDENIADIVNVRWVMKSGEAFDPDALYRSLAIAPVTKQ